MTKKNKSHSGNPQNKSRGQISFEQQEITAYQGILPPPDMLQKFNEIIPNGADRILTMAEKQSAHRIDIESKVISSDIKKSQWGVGCAFLIAVIGFGTAIGFAALGYPTQGAIIGGTTLVSLVGTFIYGTNSRKRERIEKAKQNP